MKTVEDVVQSQMAEMAAEVKTSSCIFIFSRHFQKYEI